MSYQVQPANSLLQQSLTDSNPSYEYSGYQDEAVIVQKGPSKGGFVRRIIGQPGSEVFSADERDTNAMTINSNVQITNEGSPRSGCVVVNFPDQTDFYQMDPQSSEDGSMQNLRNIINEAKRAERHFFTGGDNDQNNGNYIKIRDEEPDERESYSESDMEFTRIPPKVRKTSNQGVEIDLTEESMEKDLNNYMNQESKSATIGGTSEGLSHSKSSYLSGSVRYSKMPEEEAASIFEQRRKELLGNLLQKGKRKNLRIFQNSESHGNRGFGSPDAQGNNMREKSSPGFVIMNTRKQSATKTRNVESPTPMAKNEGKQTALRKSATAIRTKPHSAGLAPQSAVKKENSIPVNKFNASRPKLAEKRELSKKESLKEIPRNSRKEEPSNMISIDWRTLKYGINKDAKRNVDEPLEEVTKTHESETFQESMARDTYTKSLNKRNQGIWAEIEELDQQIQQLEESKSGSMPGYEDMIYRQGGWQKPQKAHRGLFDMHIKGKYEEDENINMKSNDKTTSTQLISDRYKLDGEELLLANETENVYKRYPCDKEKIKSPRIYSRKSPPAGEFSAEKYAHSHRDLINRRSHNHYEYLYQRALEQKEAREMQAENRRREKERAELLKCTFSPTIRAKSIEYYDDFETRARNWQSRKEQKLKEIEDLKQRKEMAECTFFPNSVGRRQDLPFKFDPNDFYNRNLEWKKRIEAADSKKQEEFFKLMTLPVEKSEYHPPSHQLSSGYSRGPYVQRMTEKLDDAPLSGRSYSRKHNKSTTPGRMMTLTTDSSVSRLHSHKKQRTHTNTGGDDIFNKKYDNTKARPDNYESVELLDILRRVVTSKSDKSEGVKSRAASQSPKKNVRTTQNFSLKKKPSKPEHPSTSNTVGYSLPTRGSRNGSSEAPLLFSDLNPNTLKNNTENLVIKNNKYYVARKLSPKNQLYTSDKKDDISSGSVRSPKQSLQTEASEAPTYEFNPRIEQENKTFKRKPLSGKTQNPFSPPDLFGNQAFEPAPNERVPLAAKHLNRNSDSSKNPVDYVRKSNTKEGSGNPNKKFAGAINTGDNVASNLEQVMPETASPQNDSSLGKKRRINFSLY